jgi:catechol 2,3-dioxygenase-like lactoylglutathione lyase family enzyme/ketosteroid isomerase-like protein
MGTEAENLARAQEAYTYFRAGDLARGVQLFSEEVTYVQPGVGGLSGVLRGRDAVQQHIAKVKEKKLRNRPQQWFASGSRVLLLTQISVQGETFTAVDVMTFEGNEVVHFESVTDTAVMDRVYPRRPELSLPLPAARLDHIAINVRNLDESVAWYQEMLGAVVVSDAQRNVEPFSIVTVEFAGTRIDLGSRNAMEVSALAGATPAEVTQVTGITHIAVAVDDLQRAYDQLAARGVQFVGTPKLDKSSGARYGWLIDLDGNHIELLQRA